MNNPKIVTAKKSHICTSCQRPISKGEQYEYGSMRIPCYDKEDLKIGIKTQIGVEYVVWNICLKVDCQEVCDKNIDIEVNKFHEMIEQEQYEAALENDRLSGLCGREVI